MVFPVVFAKQDDTIEQEITKLWRDAQEVNFIVEDEQCSAEIVFTYPGCSQQETDCSNFPCKKNKVNVCHKPGTSVEKTLCISKNAVLAHLGHGDNCGFCGQSNYQCNDSSICTNEICKYYDNVQSVLNQLTGVHYTKFFMNFGIKEVNDPFITIRENDFDIDSFPTVAGMLNKDESFIEPYVSKLRNNEITHECCKAKATAYFDCKQTADKILNKVWVKLGDPPKTFIYRIVYNFVKWFFDVFIMNNSFNEVVHFSFVGNKDVDLRIKVDLDESFMGGISSTSPWSIKPGYYEGNATIDDYTRKITITVS